MDVLTAEQRHKCMSRIRGKDTRPELALRTYLWARGFRYRVSYKLPGKPDLVFVSKRVVVFVDGCFWHCCPQHLTRPSTNRRFWDMKLNRNVERDKTVNNKLYELGWDVIRIWEHEVKGDIETAANRVIAVLSERNCSQGAGVTGG